jgi:hypothetical protein
VVVEFDSPHVAQKLQLVQPQYVVRYPAGDDAELIERAITGAAAEVERKRAEDEVT